MNLDQIVKMAVLKRAAEDVLGDDECTDPSHIHKKNLSIERQKEILADYLKESPTYVNPFSVGDAVIRNPVEKKYKWPDEKRPGVVVETLTGKDAWTYAKGHDKVAFEDTMIAVVDKNDGEVMFYRVDSHYLIKA